MWPRFKLISIFILCFHISLANATVANSATYLQQAELVIFKAPASALEKTEKALLLATENRDTLSMARALYLKGIYYTYAGETNTGEQYFTNASGLIKHFPDNPLKVDLLLETGELTYNRGKFEKALLRWLAADKLAKAIQYEAGEANALNYIGKYHYSTGNLSRSLHYYKAALLITSRIGDQELMISIKNNIGKYYETLALYEKALEEYLSAYKLCKNSQNLVNIATTYNHLGNIYEDLGDRKQALSYHFKALKLRNSIGYVEGIAKSEKNIGEVYEKLGTNDSALFYYQNSYKRCQQIDYKKGMIKSLYLSGSIYQKTGFAARAESNYMEALSIAQEIGYVKGLLDVHLHLGQFYLEENNEDMAQKHLLKGISIASENPLNELLEALYFEMYRLHYSGGHLEQALAYYQKYADQQKKMLDFEKQRNIEELKLAFEIQKQEQANKILRQENELKNLALRQQNTLIIVAGAGILVLLLLIVMVWHRYRLKVKANHSLEILNKRITKKNRELRRLNKELDVVNKEKDKFFSIIAHELRNPLWWFKNLAETLNNNFEIMSITKQKKAVNSLNESAKTAFHLMDNLLQWSRSQLGRIQHNPNSIQVNDLILHNIRVFEQETDHKDIEISLEVPEQLYIHADRQLTDTVLRNLISNAIKYTPDNGKISINATEKADSIEITVSDTGIGIPEKVQKHLFDPNTGYTTLGLYQEKGSGLGLLLCKEFTEMNAGSIWVQSKENEGTTIGITLPVAREVALV